MNIKQVRWLLVQQKVELRFSDHAVIEARKDGLTEEDIAHTVSEGEILEDYGERVLLLSFTTDDELPCHIVLEYIPRTDEVTVVTAYIPDSKEWEHNWKKRRRKRRR